MITLDLTKRIPRTHLKRRWGSSIVGTRSSESIPGFIRVVLIATVRVEKDVVVVFLLVVVPYIEITLTCALCLIINTGAEPLLVLSHSKLVVSVFPPLFVRLQHLGVPGIKRGQLCLFFLSAPRFGLELRNFTGSEERVLVGLSVLCQSHILRTRVGLW